jgi:MATE family multidrug resistance protein
MILVGIK